MPAEPRFVIIGASLAGAKAAETLREEGFGGAIVLVGTESERPYERPRLSKGFLLGKEDKSKIYVHEEGWYSAHDVDLRLGVTAVAVHSGDHRVELAGGDVVGYDKLLLTTGASPRRLNVPGGELEDVLYLRSAGDSERLAAAFRATGGAGGRVVIAGGGWIGLETAAAARSYGCEVTVVEPEPAPLNRVLGPELGEVFAGLHRRNGVEFRLRTGVSEFRSGPAGQLRTVVTTDGTELAADLAVVGIGVAPNVTLAEAAGLDLADGILASSALRTSDPDIYAAGDVSNSWNPLLNRRVRVDHWANALHGGPAAARSMLGQDVSYDRVPYFYSDQYELGMEASGLPGEGYDMVVYRGVPESLEFIAFWLADGRVVAGMNVNVWDVTGDIQALIRSGARIDPDRLADPDVPVSELAAPA